MADIHSLAHKRDCAKGKFGESRRRKATGRRYLRANLPEGSTTAELPFF